MDDTPGSQERAHLADRRQAVLHYVSLSKQGFGEAFTPVLAAVERSLATRVGAPSRMKQRLGALAPEVIVYLTFRSLIATVVGRNDKNRPCTVPAAAEGIGRALEAEVIATGIATAAAKERHELGRGGPEQARLQRLRFAKRSSQSSNKKTRVKGRKQFSQVIGEAGELGTGWEAKERIKIEFDLLALVVAHTKLFQLNLGNRDTPEGANETDLDFNTEPEDDDRFGQLGRRGGKKKANLVVPTQSLWDALDRLGQKRALFTSPERDVLKSIPKDWNASYGGGYDSTPPLMLLKRKENNRLVKTFNEALAKTDLSPVYNGINALQSTAWKIDERVLKVIESVLDKPLKQIALDPSRADAIPPARRSWEQAVELARAERFYYAWQLDYRGRAYPLGSWLQPQGDDFARALLQFAEAKPVTPDGRRWLAIHGANLMKGDHPASPTRNERVALIEKHSQEICACANAPLENLFWLSQAKDKHAWRFLAFCFEWRDYLEGERIGIPYRSRLPVGMDGTCNGFQHFAALLRDQQLAQWTNVAPGPRPADLYSTIAYWVRDAIKNDQHETMAHSKDEYIQLVERKLAKTVVMIIPYGASIRGIEHNVRQYIIESGRKKSWTQQFGHEEAMERTRRAAKYLAGQFAKVLREKLPHAWAMRNWLQRCCREVIARGIPMIWISPIGLPILQSLFELRSREIQSQTISKFRIKCSLDEATDKIARADQIKASSPNFIHGLDASHMLMTAAAASKQGVTSLRTVHDCYATHAADAGRLGEVLRGEFCRLYQDDILGAHQNWVRSLLRCDLNALTPESIRELLSGWLKCTSISKHRGPRPPERGDFDLNEVKQSDYFFC